jgi:4-hydroxy-tetrahydrodipicolinate synthase
MTPDASNRLMGIIPIVFVPFDPSGEIDEAGLRQVIEFELALQPQGLGVNGFATEAYKLSDAERLRCAVIAADQIAGRVPLIVGMASGSTEAAVSHARELARYATGALMVLPPATMDYGSRGWIDHYVELAEASAVPIMIQQSPHIPAYRHTLLAADALAEIAQRAPNVRYFKIEGGNSAERIGQLRQRVGDSVGIFGGVGGIALVDELAAGADGVLPGAGFNEIFHHAWAAWQAGDREGTLAHLRAGNPLIEAVSGRGHEFSLHARKHLLHRAGVIAHPYVRRPTTAPSTDELAALFAIADAQTPPLRISRVTMG